jgi:hypothetical protein
MTPVLPRKDVYDFAVRQDDEILLAVAKATNGDRMLAPNVWEQGISKPRFAGDGRLSAQIIEKDRVDRWSIDSRGDLNETAVVLRAVGAQICGQHAGGEQIVVKGPHAIDDVLAASDAQEHEDGGGAASHGAEIMRFRSRACQDNEKRSRLLSGDRSQRPDLPRLGARQGEQLIHRGPRLAQQPRVDRVQPVGHERAWPRAFPREADRRQPRTAPPRQACSMHRNGEQTLLQLKAFSHLEVEAALPQPSGKGGPHQELVAIHKQTGPRAYGEFAAAVKGNAAAVRALG